VRPFQIVEDLGFTNVSQVLLNIGARYGRGIPGKVTAEKILPCANTIKRRIQKLAEMARAELIPRLSSAGARGELAFSPDLWTDKYKKQTYLGRKVFLL
jgi:hypothetical protein